ncbi:MAG: alpha-galactosidase [Clostridia bacterium]|nr:alpha-galactosidase [Clostridia bacterium]
MINYDKESRSFSIQTKNTSYFMRIDDMGYLRNLYYGEKIAHVQDTCMELKNMRAFEELSASLPFRGEYLSKESYIYNEPCISVEFSDGVRDLKLVYKSHEIKELPGGATLSITLKDIYYSFEVILNYTVYKDLDIINKNAVAVNLSDKPVIINKIKSGSMYPEWKKDMRVMHMAGTWASEYQRKFTNLNQGKFVIENTRGVSSGPHHVPFFAIDDKNTNETGGNVWYGLLHWSGNFRIDIEHNFDDQVMVSAGINDYDTQITLGSGEKFETPLFTVGYTNKGYEEMTRTLYDYQYDILSPRRVKNIFPIIYNSWYPYEFDIDEQKCISFVDKASAIGAELFVIDDGWFGRRDNNYDDGLGDWYCNKDKFPNGLKPVADKAHKCNMKFGLWVEPEMINKKSDLYKKHPEWVLHYPTREITEMRNQYVLNLARDDVREFVWETVDRIISEFNLDYLKWDMNRYINEADPADKEMYVKYIKNLYEVWRRINEKYPDLLLENCAHGGARADYGMAKFSDRINRSDNSDPVDVLKLHEGFSTFILPRFAGGAGNIASLPTMNGRKNIPLQYRAHLGMTGSMSVGINLLKSNEKELSELKEYISQYKEIRHITQNAYFYKLSSATETPVAAWEYLDRNKKAAVVFVFANGMNFKSTFGRIKLRNLINDKLYHVTSSQTDNSASIDAFIHGDALMNVGIRIEPMGDYFSQVIKIEEV